LESLDIWENVYAYSNAGDDDYDEFTIYDGYATFNAYEGITFGHEACVLASVDEGGGAEGYSEAIGRAWGSLSE
jgi:hypothetical protein